MKETIKIILPTAATSDFSKREKIMNVQIQNLIESYNSRGYIVLGHSVVNKSNAHASVQFDLKKMIAV